MSETSIVAIVAGLMLAIPPTIAALAAFYQARAGLLEARLAAAAAAANSVKADALAVKTDTLVGQVKEVHTLTNSNLTALKGELALALQRITSLVEMVEELRQDRQKAAVATALATPVPSPPRAAPATSADALRLETLQHIEQNTADTAENTAAATRRASRVKK